MGSSGSPESGVLRLALLAKRARADGLNSFPEPVAVIGMGCRFPGGADSPAAYWSLIERGADVIREVGPDRWSIDEWYHPDPSTPGRTSVKVGGFLATVADFDNDFFGVPLREAERMDPHQRLTLEVAWEALEDAGLRADEVWETRTGVFAASFNNDYVLHQYLRPQAINERTITGTVHSVVANRVSHFLGLHGPSLTVDTACSSSLVAIHLACRSLRDGTSDAAIAGGVSITIRPEPLVALSKAGFMAADGRCKTFDAAADGFGRGEGCGFVVLKRLADALADGDRIQAVIRGSAVNQDGHSTILAAPNGRAQVAVIEAALRDGGVEPSAVSYVEAHGTGTRLGDPIEVEALAEALGPPPGRHRWITSVKSNIGHLEAAAGVAGLIKAVLCLRHRRIPPQALFREENPLLRLADHGFVVPREGNPWTAPGPLTVGVSSFGVGGTNAHVVLEEAPRMGGKEPPPAVAGGLLTLSAKTPEALREMARRYAAGLEDGALAPLAAVCAGASENRSRFDHRLAVAARDPHEMASRLRAVADDATVPGAWSSTSHAAHGVIWVFGGQGAQWQGMGTALARECDTFRQALAEIDETLVPLSGWSIFSALQGEAGEYDLDDTLCAQVAIFGVQVGLARTLRDWGFEPNGVIGHSVGEVAAAHVAGLLTLAEAVRVVYHRGRVMQRAEAGGAMLAARLSPADAARALEGHSGIRLAATNGPRSIVFSGAAAAVEALGAQLARDGVKVKRLEVEYGFHSHLMAPFETELRSAVSGVQGRTAPMHFYSTVTGEALQPGGFDSRYIARNVVSPVRFHEAVSSAIGAGAGVFIELSPRPTLLTSIMESAEALGVDVATGSMMDPASPGLVGAKGAAGVLFCAGFEGRWSRVHGATSVVVDLPLYPWQRVRCWLDAPERGRSSDPGASSDLLGRMIDSPALNGVLYERWVTAEDKDLADHVIGGTVLVPGAMMLEMARRAASSTGHARAVINARFLTPVALSEGGRSAHFFAGRDGDSEALTLHVRTASGPWRRVFSAEGRTSPMTSWPGRAALDEIRNRCASRISHDDFYRKAADLGSTFGPAYRRVREVRFGEGEALASLDADGYDAKRGPEPALLDAVLQPIVALLDGGRRTYVPASAESYRWAVSGTPCVSWVRERGTGSEGARTFDLQVLAEDGQPVASIEGLIMRPLPMGFSSLLEPERNLYSVEWSAVDSPEGLVASEPLDRWVVYSQEPEAVPTVQAALTASGADVTVASTLDELDGASAGVRWGLALLLTDALPKRRGRGDDVLKRVESLMEPLLRGARTDNAAPSRIVVFAWSADRGAGAATPSPWVASLEGLGRTYRSERPDISTTVMTAEHFDQADLDLVSTLCQGTVSEPVIRSRSGRIWVPRLVKLDMGPMSAEPRAPRALMMETAGDIDSLRLRDLAPASPGTGQVEVGVRVAALNFRDVLAGLGMVEARTTDALGHEAAGVVTRVGPGVGGLEPGDAVVTLAEGAFAERVTCSVDRVLPKPEGLDWSESASLPVAYLTAYHALVFAAGVQKGQRILVHSAAGGVGRAAVHLGLALGAEVYATAGSPERRAMVRELGAGAVFDSHSASFGAEVLAHTRGRGVDVVVNSLVGEAVNAGLASLVRGGTFVELGKRDLRNPAEVAAQHPGVRYVAFDLFDELDAAPGRYREAWSTIVDMVRAGRLPVLPRQEYPWDRAADAWRLMSRGGHIGKVLLRLPGRNGREVRGDGTYLVTGATGAVGLRTVRWLVERGARDVVVTSRTRPDGEANQVLADLRSTGAVVEWVGADISRAKDTRHLFEHIALTGRTLRGVVHSAGAVRDALLGDMGPEVRGVALGAKVAGAWNLLQNLDAEGLDFFFLYSAGGSLLDPAGQGAYAAANAVIDRLAEDLRHSGWPATSIQWGLWEGGMAGRMTEAQTERWRSRGLRPLSDADAGTFLDYALRADRPLIAPIPIDWTPYRAAMHAMDPLFSVVADAKASPTAPSGRLTTSLTGLPVRRRRQTLRAHLRDRLLRVLGARENAQFDDTLPFHDLNMDSLMAVEYRNTLTRDLGTRLSATVAFDYPDLDALTLHLDEILFGRGRDQAAVPLSTDDRGRATGSPLDSEYDVGALSEEDAERMLVDELEALRASDRP